VDSSSSVFLDFVRAVVDGDLDEVSRRLARSPVLATAVSDVGATPQQAGIVRLLLERGASATDQDRNGKEVYQAATSEWIRALLRESPQATRP
jgi:hypothetical protein